MSRRGERIEILDPVDRWIHWIAMAGVLGALASGPLLENPGWAAAAGIGPERVGAVHGVAAAAVAVAAGLHLARVALWWLEGRNPWGLVPRPGDLRDLVVALLHGVGVVRTLPDRDRFSHRERLGYLGLVAGLSVLLATGWMVSHPGLAVRWLGPDGLVGVARVHAAAGLALVLPLCWHIYFGLLAPEKLWWNPSWLTGRLPLVKAREVWPAWVEARLGPARETGQEAMPSVEDLLDEGNRAARAGDWERARERYEEALRLYPGYVQALFNLGVVCLKAGDRVAARAALQRLLDQDPFGPAAPRARELLAGLEADAGGDREG